MRSVGFRPNHNDISSQTPECELVRRKARAAACTVGRKSLNAATLRGKIKAPSFEPRFGVRPEALSSNENSQWAERANACDVNEGQGSCLIESIHNAV